MAQGRMNPLTIGSDKVCYRILFPRAKSTDRKLESALRQRCGLRVRDYVMIIKAFTKLGMGGDLGIPDGQVGIN